MQKDPGIPLLFLPTILAQLPKGHRAPASNATQVTAEVGKKIISVGNEVSLTF